ncbi:MAG: sigma-70 family RNA polymerase sigma factor [Verrucomicrobiota bacterium]
MKKNLQSTGDTALLQRYTEAGDEDAFAELVSRYLDLVYGVAFRAMGEKMAAEEVCQNTFAILSRKAIRVAKSQSLGGWLMKTARLEAMKAHRTAYRRRRKHEALARNQDRQTMNDEADHQAVWKEALPHLDEALAQLPPGDREVIAQRFYRNLRFAEMGELTGRTEDGARKHLSRALDRLSSLLRFRKAVVPAATLATGLSMELSKANGLNASSMATSALAKAPGIGTGTLVSNTILTQSLLTMANAKPFAATAAIVIAAGTAGFQWNAHSRLTREVQTLESNFARIDSPRAGENPIPQTPLSHPSTLTSAPSVEWTDLISLFDRTRLGGKAAYRLFVEKIRLLDAQRQFTGTDLGPALDELAAAGADARLVREVGTTLVLFTAKRDPAGCADAVLKDARIERWRLGIVLENYGKQDAEAAIAWHEDRLKNGDLDPVGRRDANMAQSSLGSLIAGVAQTDLGKAKDLLTKVTDQAARRGIYRLAFVLDEPDQRIDFIESLADETTLQNHAILAYARAGIESESPATSWTFLEELSVERTPGEKAAIMVQALENEAMRDMERAPDIADWVTENRKALPNDGSVEQLLKRNLNQWKIRHPEEAKSWENTHRELLGSAE